MRAESYFMSPQAVAESPMNKRRTWRGGRSIMAAIFCLPLAGCQVWQPLWPGRAEKPGQAETKKAESELDKPRSRTTGRSPIQSTGLNEQSREIERSLGAR